MYVFLSVFNEVVLNCGSRGGSIEYRKMPIHTSIQEVINTLVVIDYFSASSILC